MKVRRVRFGDGGTSAAVEHAGRWVPLVPALDRWRMRGGSPSPALAAAAGDVLGYVSAGEPVWQETAELLRAVSGEPYESVEPDHGLPFRPVSFRDCALWEQHLIDAGRTLVRLGSPARARAVSAYEKVTGRVCPLLRPKRLWYERPTYYKGNPTTFVADGATVPWPSYAQALDYELEIGIVIGAAVRDATPEAALDAARGFVLLDDVSARDVQYGEMVEERMGPAKSKDFATVMSEVVVTADEIVPYIGDLSAQVLVNGETWSSGTTAGMRYTLGELLAFLSLGEALAPGEVVGTGTLPGCSGVEIDRWLSPGDTVEFVVDRLGTLQSVMGTPEPWLRPGRLRRSRWSVVVRAGETADPVSIEPVAWSPPRRPPLTGALEPNTLLDHVERWEIPGGSKPEDVVVDADGRVYAGVEDGRIFRWPAGGGEPEVFADTHGRPCGIELDADGRLVVCDAYRGLLRAGHDGALTVLVDTYDGARLRLTNNAAVGADGTIYFSDTSTRFRIEHYKLELLEHRGNGRLFAHDPSGGETRLLLGGLHFANGVALAADESYVLVVETGKYRVTRLWLRGDRAGESDVFTDNLPGVPDNLASAGDGTFWLALPGGRLPVLDRTLPWPWLRRFIARLPERMLPEPRRYAMIVRLGRDGQVLQSLHGPAGSFAQVTGMREAGDWLYLSSLVETAIGRVPVPRLPS